MAEICNALLHFYSYVWLKIRDYGSGISESDDDLVQGMLKTLSELTDFGKRIYRIRVTQIPNQLCDFLKVLSCSDTLTLSHGHPRSHVFMVRSQGQGEICVHTGSG